MGERSSLGGCPFSGEWSVARSAGWSASGILAWGGTALLRDPPPGDLGRTQSSMEPPILGTYHVLGALHGFSTLNFPEIHFIGPSYR